jgi:sulfite exporter TauE/SafE
MTAKVYIRSRKWTWFPESFAYIVIGAIFGTMLVFTVGEEAMNDHYAFSASTFNVCFCFNTFLKLLFVSLYSSHLFV